MVHLFSFHKITLIILIMYTIFYNVHFIKKLYETFTKLRVLIKNRTFIKRQNFIKVSDFIRFCIFIKKNAFHKDNLYKNFHKVDFIKSH